MSIPKLALLVFALLAGTAVSVQSYLESRRPIVLSPRVLLREMPARLAAPRPGAPEVHPAALPDAPQAALPSLDWDPSGGTPSAAALRPETPPALVVEASAPRPAAGVTRWTTVRRDGTARCAEGGSSPRVRAIGGCSSQPAAPAAAGRPVSAPSGACSRGPATQVRLN